MRLLTTLRSFLNRDLLKQSLLAGFFFWLCLQIPLLFATHSYLRKQTALKSSENKKLLSTVLEETFKSNARFGDLVNTRGQLLKYGKQMGLKGIGICRGGEDVLSKMNENDCLIPSDYEFDYSQGDTNLKVRFIWSESNEYDKLSFLPMLLAFSFLSLIFTFSTSMLTYSFVVSKIKVLSKKIARSAGTEKLSLYRTNVPELNLLLSSITLLQKRSTKRENEIFELKKRSFLFELSEQIAHDIRSPLSALNLVTKTVETTEEKRGLISGALQRINDIAANILNVSQLIDENNFSFLVAGDSTQPKISTIDINFIVAALVKEKKLEHQGKLKIEIRLDLDTDATIRSHASSSILLRVLSNLINNAFESILDAGIITVGTRAYESMIIISVTDNGIGMSEETLEALGEKGFTAGKEKGNGLGFYHAKKFIAAAGGNLEVRSHVGVGTMVEIKLPRANT